MTRPTATPAAPACRRDAEQALDDIAADMSALSDTDRAAAWRVIVAHLRMIRSAVRASATIPTPRRGGRS